MQNDIPQKLPSRLLCFSFQGPGGLRRFRNSREALLPPSFLVPVPRLGLWAWLRARPRDGTLVFSCTLLLAPYKPSLLNNTYKPEKANQTVSQSEPFSDTTDSDLQARPLDWLLLHLTSFPSTHPLQPHESSFSSPKQAKLFPALRPLHLLFPLSPDLCIAGSY